MKKTVKMATKEMWEEAAGNREKIIALAKLAPEFSVEEIPELDGFVPGKAMRGFAAFKEYINKNGRPKSEDPRVNVSIRIPRSYAAKLRKSGPGWQTRMGEFLIKGIDRKDKSLLTA
jgi:uncharacterized protein (DUF4415 family)